MDDVSLVFGGIQTTAIVVGIVLALMELRHLREQRKTELDTRQAQLFMQVYSPFASKEFQHTFGTAGRMSFEDYEDFRQKYYGAEGSLREDYESYVTVANYFEGVGMLVKRGLLDISFVENLLSTHIVQFWSKFGSHMMETRENWKRPRMWEWVEFLYRELEKQEEKLGPQKN